VVAPDRLATFALASLVFVLVPGPSVLFVVSRGVALGRRAAVATVVGNAVGVYVHVVAVAAGLGVVLARSAAALQTLRMVGALYLAWLGVRAWRERRHLALSTADGVPILSLARAAREGFVVGLGNPKSMLFFAAILPQFVDPAAGHVAIQMLLLGLLFVLIALVSDSTYGVLAGSLRAWLSGSPRRLERLGAAGGLGMIGLGIGLLVQGRPQR
jgi:threonine/homoserine/homoserine lactone efflux protein